MPKKNDPDYINPEKPLDRAKKRFKDFVRASDAVEWVDPTGATEEVFPSDNERNPYSGSKGKGRSTVKITAYGCQLVEFYAAQGLPHALIAKRLGMGEMGFRCRMQDQPEVCEALSRGMADNEYELGECLMGMARRGNVIAAIYLTKCMHKWRDNDPVQQLQQNNVVIQLPGSMSLEDLKTLAASGVSPMQLVEATETPRLLPVIDTTYES